MSFFDFLSSFAKSVAKSTARQRSDYARRFERENPDMDDQTRQKLEKFKQQTEKLEEHFGVSAAASSRSTSTIMGKTLAEWDGCWQSIGMLKDANLSPYGHCVGLYRHVIDGTTKYVGRAVELQNGGFRKRLSDYRRDSDSARKHLSGQIIHSHLDEIETYILVVGDTEEAVTATKKLEGMFINLYHPAWNRQINI